MRILAVGSRVWGKPRPDSDFDIVVLAETDQEVSDLQASGVLPDHRKHRTALTLTLHEPDEGGYVGLIIKAAFRAGPFNVILVETPWQFGIWEKGAAWMDVEKRSNGLGYVTRDRAVEILQALAKGEPIPSRAIPDGYTNREYAPEATEAKQGDRPVRTFAGLFAAEGGRASVYDGPPPRDPPGGEG